MESVIDQPHLGVLQDFDEVIVIPVKVADGDDFVDLGPFAGDRCGGAEAREGEEKKAGRWEKDSFMSFVRHGPNFLSYLIAGDFSCKKGTVLFIIGPSPYHARARDIAK
jgi:hypothetical protein